MLQRPVYIKPITTLDVMLEFFKNGKTHCALIYQNSDVIEDYRQNIMQDFGGLDLSQASFKEE